MNARSCASWEMEMAQSGNDEVGEGVGAEGGVRSWGNQEKTNADCGSSLCQGPSPIKNYSLAVNLASI